MFFPVSACGTKQTLMPTMSMSASGGKADIPDTPHQCPLMTQIGHERALPLHRFWLRSCFHLLNVCQLPGPTIPLAKTRHGFCELVGNQPFLRKWVRRNTLRKSMGCKSTLSGACGPDASQASACAASFTHAFAMPRSACF